MDPRPRQASAPTKIENQVGSLNGGPTRRLEVGGGFGGSENPASYEPRPDARGVLSGPRPVDGVRGQGRRVARRADRGAEAGARRLGGVTGLTHIDPAGAARMVDVSAKPESVRSATATGRLLTTAGVVALLQEGGLPKGDALAVARVAGIMGAKRTPDLVPLCHPIALHSVAVELSVLPDGVLITATTRTADRTGVEMEALTAVAVAGLALVDMVKAVDPAATITDVRVERKSGGRSGEWRRDAARRA